ncbi:HD domain-containing protein [Patescibacteria group bacterium]|nr:HD domain-containing protein [Patescibacteria group bacterium]
MIILKDPLYGFISLEEPFKSLIETEQFQRLRNIKQLGLSYLIYPSAHHSRFEHSIGAFYLAQKIIEKISTEKAIRKDKILYGKEFMAAALLHDIGHYPFSHAIEKSIGLLNGASHEQQTINIIRRGKIAEVIKKSKLNIGIICDFIKGGGKFGKLISGQIDVDRLDYLKRDSYYTGVAYGVIEVDVIIKSMEVVGKKYFVDEKYLPAFESILISRYLMYSMVYMHRKTLIANNMLRAAFEKAISAGEILPDEIAKFDDIDFIAKLRSSKTAAKNLINQISNRDLYQEAIIFKKEDLPNFKKIKNIKNISKIEKIIADRLEIKNYEILINILNFPKISESEILIAPSGKNLEKASPMVKALNEAEWNHWLIGVYCPKKHLKKIKKARSLIKKYLIE